MKPYKERKEEGKIIRVFSENSNDNEFVWHRDREDRIVYLLRSHPKESPHALAVG